MREPTMLHRLAAEFIGTFWLVLGGCGSAVFAAQFASADGVSLGIGFLGVALAFGLTVLTGVYAFGTISGGHFNPAVTLGAALARRVEWKVLPAYWFTQVIGGLAAGIVIYVIAKGQEGWTATGNMAANGFGEHSPGGYSIWAVIITEVVLTGIFMLVILGSTDDRAPKGFAGLSIGLDADADPSDLDSHLEHVGQPGTVDRRRVLQRRWRADAALGVLVGTADRRRHRGSRLPVPVRLARRTRGPSGAGRRVGGRGRRLRRSASRDYLTGAFFLARLAADFSVFAPLLASCPPEFSRCARTNHWNFSNSPAWPMKMILGHQVEVVEAVDALAQCPRSRRCRPGRAPRGAPARCRGRPSSRPRCGP